MANGNGKTSLNKTAGKGFQMLAADIVGNTAELVFLKYQENFDNAFPFLKSAFKKVMYAPFKLLQSPIEWTINKFGKSIEGDEGFEKRRSQTAEQRLDGLLDSSYHYASAIAVGWSSLVAAEKTASYVNGSKGIPGRMWTRVDLPVHLGMTAFLGSSLMKPATGALKDVTKKILIASGWSEQKAEQDSRFAMAYILPNYVTLIPTVGMMGSLYKAESQGVVKDVGKKALFGLPEHHFELTGKKAEGLGKVTEGMLKIAKTFGVIDGPGKSLH